MTPVQLMLLQFESPFLVLGFILGLMMLLAGLVGMAVGLWWVCKDERHEEKARRAAQLDDYIAAFETEEK